MIDVFRDSGYPIELRRDGGEIRVDIATTESRNVTDRACWTHTLTGA
jgi:hypothetical protein